VSSSCAMVQASLAKERVTNVVRNYG
jgi:hypothetical protein